MSAAIIVESRPPLLVEEVGGDDVGEAMITVQEVCTTWADVQPLLLLPVVVIRLNHERRTTAPTPINVRIAYCIARSFLCLLHFEIVKLCAVLLV